MARNPSYIDVSSASGTYDKPIMPVPQVALTSPPATLADALADSSGDSPAVRLSRFNSDLLADYSRYGIR